MKHWAFDLIGRRWLPDFPCWALVRECILRRSGIDLPPLGGVGDLQAADSVATIMHAAAGAGYHAVDGPAQEDDVLLCRDSTGKRHAGYVIDWRDKLQLLHNDGYMSERGPVGSVIRQPMVEATQQLKDIELWRRA